MSREQLIRSVQQHFDGGAFAADLARRVAWRTESDTGTVPPELRTYLPAEMVPAVWMSTAQTWSCQR